MKVNPAILVNNYSSYLFQIGSLINVTKEFDIDIINWNRTNTKTISIDEALNVKGDLILNFDLMVDKPQSIINKLILDKRVNNIIINLDCRDDIIYLIDLIHHHNKKAGISINPDRKLYEITPYFNDVDIIQIYTVEPGSQGNTFLKDRLELIQFIKDNGFIGKIEIDGGINFNNIKIIKEYNIDIVSVGSTISKADNPEEIYLKLMKLLN